MFFRSFGKHFNNAHNLRPSSFITSRSLLEDSPLPDMFNNTPMLEIGQESQNQSQNQTQNETQAQNQNTNQNERQQQNQCSSDLDFFNRHFHFPFRHFPFGFWPDPEEFERSVANKKGESYSQVSMTVSSSTGEGRPKIEKYVKTSCVDSAQNLRETREAYSNSHTGVDKCSIERELDKRGVRTLMERNRKSNKYAEDKQLINLTDEALPEFENQWSSTKSKLSRLFGFEQATFLEDPRNNRNKPKQIKN